MTDEMPRRLPKYCFEDKRRNGKARIRLRRPGFPRVTLHGTPWSASFMEAYARAMGEAKPSSETGQTWGWLCRQFFATAPGFKAMSQRSRTVRRRILERTFDEPLKPDSEDLFRDMPKDAMTPKAVRVLRDRISDRPEAANARLKAIRQVFAWAVRMEHVETNPAREVEYLRPGTDGFHAWTPEEVEAYESRHGPRTRARLAVRLLLYAGGPRRSDVVRLGRQHVKDGWIKYRPIKTNDVAVEVPVLPELGEELAAVPANQMTFLQTAFGKPFTPEGFGNWFKRRCREAGIPHCAAHGLRKAAATIAAENGATDAQLMAIFGWTDPKMPAHYTRKARRKKMAGEGMHFMGSTVQNKRWDSM